MNESILKLISDLMNMSMDELFEGLDRKDLWSSLLWMEIVFSLEEEFDIQFEESELAQLATPRKLCQAAEQKIHSKETQ